MKGKFVEVVKPEKLVFIAGAFHDENGVPGIENINTVTFTEQNGKTTMKLESRFTKVDAKFALALSGAKAGWTQSIDRLEGLLTGNPELVITRFVDAPRELVWKAHTEIDRLKQWWGPKGMPWVSVNLDLRPGGMFHYGMETPNGVTWLKYVYREIDSLERLSFIFSLSDEKKGTARNPMSATWPLEVLSTITFFEVGGKTAIIMSMMPVNATEEERKTFEHGRQSVTGGFNGAYAQLEEYLAKSNKESK